MRKCSGSGVAPRTKKRQSLRIESSRRIDVAGRLRPTSSEKRDGAQIAACACALVNSTACALSRRRA